MDIDERFSHLLGLSCLGEASSMDELKIEILQRMRRRKNLTRSRRDEVHMYKLNLRFKNAKGVLRSWERK